MSAKIHTLSKLSKVEGHDRTEYFIERSDGARKRVVTFVNLGRGVQQAVWDDDAAPTGEREASAK